MSTSASCCATAAPLASLNHPNIVTIMTAEKQENVFFIVMEFVPGETLETIIARDGALDLSLALDYTCQICNAVDHAHRQGVLHRDLRPSNVLVAESGMLKVADFGTSRFLEIAAHGTTVIGSPPYMAPEQFHGKAVFASDLYSIGVTMYQMMTGFLPYDTPSPADLDRLMRGELVTAPRLKNPKIPKVISDIVIKALAPEIAKRYQRASELLDDVLAARRRCGLRRTPRGTPAGRTGRQRRRTKRRRSTAASRRASRRSRVSAIGIAASFALHARSDQHVRSAAKRTALGAVNRNGLRRNASTDMQSNSGIGSAGSSQGKCAPEFESKERMMAFPGTRQDLDEREARGVEGRDHTHRVACHPLRQRRVRRARAATRRRRWIRLLPSGRLHAAALPAALGAKIYRMEYPARSRRAG